MSGCRMVLVRRGPRPFYRCGRPTETGDGYCRSHNEHRMRHRSEVMEALFGPNWEQRQEMVQDDGTRSRVLAAIGRQEGREPEPPAGHEEQSEEDPQSPTPRRRLDVYRSRMDLLREQRSTKKR